jgi:phage recombination protein Bet
MTNLWKLNWIELRRRGKMSENQEKYEVEESPLGRIVITEAQVDIIKTTIAKGASNDELKLFFYECRRRGVHPMDRLIHFLIRGDDERGNRKVTFQASIDFLRGQAEETGEYRGQDVPEFGPTVEGTKFPSWAKVTVRRFDKDTGEVYPISAIAYWDEYCPASEKMRFMWNKMPHSQLAKCAEALALRKAFPKKIASLYSFEEMEQADMIEAPKGNGNKPPITEPKRASQPTPKADDGKKITENQGKRFFAIASGAKKTKEDIESFLYAQIGSTHTKDIPSSRYDDLCQLVTTWKPGQSEQAPDWGELGPEPGSDG